MLAWGMSGSCLFAEDTDEVFTEKPDATIWHSSDHGKLVTYIGPSEKSARKELIFSRERLTEQSVTIHIESDARSCGMICGQTDFHVTFSGKTNDLILRPGDDAGILLNGQEQIPLKGRWIGILVRETDLQVIIRFDEATYVNLRIDEIGDKRSVGPGKATTEHDETDALAKPSPAMLEHVKPSVCQVWIFRKGSEEPVGSGSGFLVDDKGLIVTNFHVVQGVDSAKVVFAEDNQKLDTTLVDVRPDIDLALLQVDMKQLDNSRLHQALPIASKVPRNRSRGQKASILLQKRR